jgi:hypothetical protein
MASVEEFDTQIAEKDRDVAALTEAAEAAQQRCLDRFGAAFSAKIAEQARHTVAAEPALTQDLEDSGRLKLLKGAVQSLQSQSRQLVEQCLRGAKTWVHLQPAQHQGRHFDHVFQPERKGPNSTGSLYMAWRDPMKCLAGHLERVFTKYGYTSRYFRLDAALWPTDVWEALGDYATCAQSLMRAWIDRSDLQKERAKLSAQNAWDRLGSD